MNTEKIVLTTIKELTGEDVGLDTNLADLFDSLSMVEFAITLSDSIGSNTLFERKELYECRTAEDVARVMDMDLSQNV